MSYVIEGMVEQYLCDHPSIAKRKKLTSRAATTLIDLYQAFGRKHLTADR